MKKLVVTLQLWLQKLTADRHWFRHRLGPCQLWCSDVHYTPTPHMVNVTFAFPQETHHMQASLDIMIL